MSRPDYIASDVHLGAVPAATEHAFVAFLEHAGAHANALLLNGDIFDFWFEYGTVIPGRHFRALAAIANVVDAGVPVTLVGGNHDAWGGRFLREEVGVTFYADPFYMMLGARRALVAHGDGLGTGDRKYRMLKRVVRSRLAIGAFRVLHPELGMRLAGAVSSTGHRSPDDPGVSRRAAALESWADSQLAANPALPLVVCGHAHQPVIKEFSPGRYYVNSGAWITRHTYVTIAPGSAPVLVDWRMPTA